MRKEPALPIAPVQAMSGPADPSDDQAPPIKPGVEPTDLSQPPVGPSASAGVEPTDLSQPPVGPSPSAGVEPTAVSQRTAERSPADGLVLNERYVVENELGRGGMSRVFIARDIKLGRRVAIKFLAPNVQDDDGLRR